MKIISIVGTRPQFLKLAPLAKRFSQYNINHKIVHSGQHYDMDMSENIFNILNIQKPDYLIQKKGNSEIEYLCNMMLEIEKILLIESPDKIIVYGDCDTTIAGSIVAKKLKIYLIHIEAGMRSYNKDMPEEINRLMTDNISDLLLCSTMDSVNKLKSENIYNNVYYVGNLQLELLKECCQNYNNDKILNENNVKQNEFVLLTIHRAYNTTINNLTTIFMEIGKINDMIIFPIHPRTKNIINNNNIVVPSNIILINPVDYLDMTILERYSKYIITDSGGVQPEAYYLGKKCVIMRTETEWVELLANNNNILYDYKTPLNIFIENFLSIKVINNIDFLLDSYTSQHIVDIILDRLTHNHKIKIPIGIGCKTATLLKKYNLRTLSFPFDYLNCDIKHIKMCLEDNFQVLINKDNFYLNNETQTYGHKIWGRKLFMHYPNLDTITKYCSRFIFTINNLKNLTFICSFVHNENKTSVLNIEYFNEIKKILSNKNKIFRFKMIIINNGNKIDFDYGNDIIIWDINEKIKGATHIPSEIDKHYGNLYNTLHIFYTKFMYVSADFLNRGYTKDKILSDENILPRLEVLKQYYLKWVNNQKNKNFIVIIIIDKDLPSHLITKLQNEINEYKNILLMRYNNQTLSYNYLISKKSFDDNNDLNLNKMNYIINLFGLNIVNCKIDFDNINIDYLITTRIDDDDMIPNWFTDQLQKMVINVNDFKLVGGNVGYVILPSNKLYKTHLSKLDKKGLQSIGLSLIQKTNNNIKEYFNIFSFPHHTCLMKLPDYNNHKHLFRKNPEINNNNIQNYYYEYNIPSFIYNRINSTSIYEFDIMSTDYDINEIQLEYGDII